MQPNAPSGRLGLDRDRLPVAIGEEPLAGPARPAVHQLPDPLEAEARHPDVVGVGVGERQGEGAASRQPFDRALVGAVGGPVLA